MSESSQNFDNKQSIYARTEFQQPSEDYQKLLQQFQQHSAQLSSQGISDQELSIALESLVHFASNFKLNCWHNIVSQSSIIEAVSSLMFETTNPNIRNMCGTVLYILQQRGTETNEIVDWKMLVQPLVSLLFNPNILISELGKQIILEKISKKPEILQQLIEIGLFEHALEEINSFIPSSSSSQNQLLEAKDIIPLQVLGNILEVVLMTIKQGILCERKISKLRIAIEKLMQDLKTQQIESIFKEILHFAEQITKIRTDQELQLDLEEKLQEYERKLKEDQDLIRIAEQRVKIAEENQRIAQEKLQESQDFKIIAEEKAKVALYRSQISEDNKRIAEDRIKVAEINSTFTDEKARKAELNLKKMKKDLDAVQQRESTYLQMLKQLQSKDNEKQRLWNEFNQYLPQSDQDLNFVHQLTSTPQNSSPQQMFASQNQQKNKTAPNSIKLLSFGQQGEKQYEFTQERQIGTPSSCPGNIVDHSQSQIKNLKPDLLHFQTSGIQTTHANYNAPVNQALIAYNLSFEEYIRQCPVNVDNQHMKLLDQKLKGKVVFWRAYIVKDYEKYAQLLLFPQDELNIYLSQTQSRLFPIGELSQYNTILHYTPQTKPKDCNTGKQIWITARVIKTGQKLSDLELEVIPQDSSIQPDLTISYAMIKETVNPQAKKIAKLLYKFWGNAQFSFIAKVTVLNLMEQDEKYCAQLTLEVIQPSHDNENQPILMFLSKADLNYLQQIKRFKDAPFEFTAQPLSREGKKHQLLFVMINQVFSKDFKPLTISFNNPLQSSSFTKEVEQTDFLNIEQNEQQHQITLSNSDQNVYDFISKSNTPPILPSEQFQHQQTSPITQKATTISDIKEEPAPKAENENNPQHGDIEVGHEIAHQGQVHKDNQVQQQYAIPIQANPPLNTDINQHQIDIEKIRENITKQNKNALNDGIVQQKEITSIGATTGTTIKAVGDDKSKAIQQIEKIDITKNNEVDQQVTDTDTTAEIKTEDTDMHDE